MKIQQKKYLILLTVLQYFFIFMMHLFNISYKFILTKKTYQNIIKFLKKKNSYK